MEKQRIDRRYVELLASVAPRKSKKWGQFGMLGFALVVLGAVMGLNGQGEIGFALLGIGFSLFAVVSYLQMKDLKKIRKEFMDYFNAHGELPPFPEDEPRKDEVKPA